MSETIVHDSLLRFFVSMKSNADQFRSQDPADVTYDNILTAVFCRSGANFFILLNFLTFIFIA